MLHGQDKRATLYIVALLIATCFALLTCTACASDSSGVAPPPAATRTPTATSLPSANADTIKGIIAQQLTADGNSTDGLAVHFDGDNLIVDHNAKDQGNPDETFSGIVFDAFSVMKAAWTAWPQGYVLPGQVLFNDNGPIRDTSGSTTVGPWAKVILTAQDAKGFNWQHMDSAVAWKQYSYHWVIESLP